MQTPDNLLLTPRARRDLTKVARYTLRKHGAVQQKIYLTALHEFFLTLVEMPGMGFDRSDLKLGLQIYTFRKDYYICYRVRDGIVQVLRIIHTARAPETIAALLR